MSRNLNRQYFLKNKKKNVKIYHPGLKNDHLGKKCRISERSDIIMIHKRGKEKWE